MFKSEMMKHTTPALVALRPIMEQIKALEEIVATSNKQCDESDPDTVEAFLDEYDAATNKLRQLLGMHVPPVGHNRWLLEDTVSTPLQSVEGFRSWGRQWTSTKRRKIKEAEQARLAAIQAEADRKAAEVAAKAKYDRETIELRERLGLSMPTGTGAES